MKINNLTITGICLVIVIVGLLVSFKHSNEPLNIPTEINTKTLEPSMAPTPAPEAALFSYLKAKNSPLVAEAGYLHTKPHWRLLVAISHIESQFCTRQLNNNCWGINTKTGYAKFATLRDAIDATDNLITKWQNKGRWLTVEDMNCSYVVPCSPNWVKVVNSTLTELETLK